MEVTPPPLMLVDQAITPREGVSGASLNKVDQPTSSGLGSAAPVLGEQLNIRALDLVGALLILIAEVREALTLVPNSPLQPIVPQSLVPEENLLEQTLLENVIPESPPLPGLVFVEPALPEIALDSPPALQLISATASPSPAQTVAPEISGPMSPLLQCLVHQGMTPWPSSSGVLLAEAALINAALRDIYSTPGAPPAQLGPATAPFAVIQMMLRRLPAEESERPAAWLVTATQVEAAVRTALDKAFDAVTAWRGVPPAVVAVVGDARTVVLAALEEDLLNPLWLMPEMMRILPRLRRYWRLRRRQRRSLDREEAILGGERDDAAPTFP